jgi:hypothetical protein
MELEPVDNPPELTADKRPKLYEPLPVRLVAIEDCRLTAPAGLERDLDDFYVGLLGFERDLDLPGLVYRAENCRLRFDVTERPQPRQDCRALGIAVDSMPLILQRLEDLKIEYIRQRGITPGMDSLLFPDPAGNPVEVLELRIAI